MKFLKYIIIAFVIVAFGACTEDFQEYNTNPNFPESVTPDLLLRNLLFQTANNMANRGWEIGNKLAQLTTNHDFNDFDRYDRLDETGLWDDSYALLRDAETIITLSESNTSFDIYKGPAMVMKAYLTGVVTDLWGDVPFSEANAAKAGNYTPVYDTQESIYTNILTMLENAATTMTNYNGGSSLDGDIMFDGNLSQWIRFANSLRLRHLLRASTKLSNVGTQMAAAVAGGVMMSNADNAAVSYLAGSNEWFLYNARQGDYALTLMTAAAFDVLDSRNDTRIATLYKTTSNAPTVYAGLAAGIDEAWKATNGFDANDFSLTGARFRDLPDAHEAILMTYAEVQFILAEAAERGLISTGAAKDYYNAGIQASFDYLDVAMPANYMAQSNVDYDQVADKWDAIITQKWIANFGVGFESYLNHRRTGYPSILQPAVANVNSDQFPVRFIYPSSEQALNETNYTAVIARQGADNINTRMWLVQ